MIEGTNESNSLLQHLNDPLLAGVPKALSSVILDFKHSFKSSSGKNENVLEKRSRRDEISTINATSGSENR